jgi:ABC-2 type transport system permease protein
MSAPVVVSARPGVPARLRRVWAYRELLAGMIRKELKVKYKDSVLGFAWSMLNPALYLLVFWFVFEYVLDNNVPDFPIYLLSGLLVWNLFAGAVGGATSSVVTNANLVKKVAFPREVLPLAAVGAAVVHFFLQIVVLGVALAGFRHAIAWEYLPLVPIALVVAVMLATSIGILLAAVNVYLRDVQHIVELLLLAWFWFTPIVWQFGQLAEPGSSKETVALLNPLVGIVLTFQRALYAQLDGPSGAILPDWSAARYLGILGAIGAVAIVLFLIAEAVFGHLEGNFAEEL